jgi:hypothetical protein
MWCPRLIEIIVVSGQGCQLLSRFLVDIWICRQVLFQYLFQCNICCGWHPSICGTWPQLTIRTTNLASYSYYSSDLKTVITNDPSQSSTTPSPIQDWLLQPTQESLLNHRHYFSTTYFSHKFKTLYCVFYLRRFLIIGVWMGVVD